MDITPQIPSGRQIIQRYGGGGFFIADKQYVGSVLVFPEHALSWPVSSFSEISGDHFTDIRNEAESIDVLLVGCGNEMAYVADEIRMGLREHGIVVEPMDTGAACRTWNVLLSEERKAAAALIAIE
ncbi:MAG: hypothetical protein CL569_12230 [Alphaproteobacteria bacterium]|nr:hypothetical protein [Alphaproteobacteria bacterium]